MDLRFLRKYLVSSKKYRIFASRNKKIKIMIQIIRFTYNDDNVASTDVDIMACSSKDCAKEIILNEINKRFNDKWKNLREAANKLDNDINGCFFSEDENTFTWHDNGKGETYLIGRINEREVNTKFQNIGVI